MEQIRPHHAFLLVVLHGISSCWCHQLSKNNLQYDIVKDWRGTMVQNLFIHLGLYQYEKGVMILVNATYFNDSDVPSGEAGKPFPKLWEYEVVEAFFLNNKTEYLEVEMSPHGQHLILLLRGIRKPFKTKLPMMYSATINGNTWTGKAHVPGEYFPPNVSKFNAFAIHGREPNRTYLTLYPDTPNAKKPDFHKLELFKRINFSHVYPKNRDNPDMKYWASNSGKMAASFWVPFSFFLVTSFIQ